MKAVDYTAGAPDDYRCKGCGAHGVKLWRGYNESPVTLRCADCAERDQQRAHKSKPDWQSEWILGRGDQIGWFVPAVPDEEGVGYWGYTAVPAAGVDWWHRLPPMDPRGPTRGGLRG